MDTFEKRNRDRRKREKREDKLARRKERAAIKQQGGIAAAATEDAPSQTDVAITDGPAAEAAPRKPAP